jgi:hypothetical protein
MMKVRAKCWVLPTKTLEPFFQRRRTSVFTAPSFVNAGPTAATSDDGGQRIAH